MAKSKRQSKGNLHEAPADHSDDLVRLKRIRGQVEGIERMIVEGRYCVDIVNQMRSAMAAMRSVESLVLERHIRHCVQDAIDSKNQKQSDEKIAELLEVLTKK